MILTVLIFPNILHAKTHNRRTLRERPVAEPAAFPGICSSTLQRHARRPCISGHRPLAAHIPYGANAPAKKGLICPCPHFSESQSQPFLLRSFIPKVKHGAWHILFPFTGCQAGAGIHEGPASLTTGPLQPTSPTGRTPLRRRDLSARPCPHFSKSQSQPFFLRSFIPKVKHGVWHILFPFAGCQAGEGMHEAPASMGTGRLAPHGGIGVNALGISKNVSAHPVQRITIFAFSPIRVHLFQRQNLSFAIGVFALPHQTPWIFSEDFTKWIDRIWYGCNDSPQPFRSGQGVSPQGRPFETANVKKEALDFPENTKPSDVMEQIPWNVRGRFPAVIFFRNGG